MQPQWLAASRDILMGSPIMSSLAPRRLWVTTLLRFAKASKTHCTHFPLIVLIRSVTHFAAERELYIYISVALSASHRVLCSRDNIITLTFLADNRPFAFFSPLSYLFVVFPFIRPLIIAPCRPECSQEVPIVYFLFFERENWQLVHFYFPWNCLVRSVIRYFFQSFQSCIFYPSSRSNVVAFY